MTHYKRWKEKFKPCKLDKEGKGMVEANWKGGDETEEVR